MGDDAVTRITVTGRVVIRKPDGTVMRIPEDLPGYQPGPSSFAREFRRQELVVKAEDFLRVAEASKRKAKRSKTSLRP
jgi:hypothetical protein